MFSRRRQRQMAIEAWEKAFAGYSISLKMLPNILEIIRNAGTNSALADELAKRFDFSTTS
jgi:hypothetical protein